MTAQLRDCVVFASCLFVGLIPAFAQRPNLQGESSVEAQITKQASLLQQADEAIRELDALEMADDLDGPRLRARASQTAVARLEEALGIQQACLVLPDTTSIIIQQALDKVRSQVAVSPRTPAEPRSTLAPLAEIRLHLAILQLDQSGGQAVIDNVAIENAVERYRRAAALRSQLLGGQNVWAATGQFDEAAALLQKGQYLEAEALLAQVAAGIGKADTGQEAYRDSTWGFASQLAQANYFLAYLLQRRGQTQRALGHLRSLESDGGSWFGAARAIEFAAALRAQLGTDPTGRDPKSTLSKSASAFFNTSLGLTPPQQQLLADGVRAAVVNPNLDALAGWLPRSFSKPLNYQWGFAFYKGALFDEQRRIFAERRHPALQPLFEQLDDLHRQVAAIPLETKDKALAAEEARGRLRDKESQLWQALARERDRLPKLLASPPASQVAAGSVLLDFFEYDRLIPAGGEQRQAAWEQRLACFVCPPARQKADGFWESNVSLVDLGPVAPIYRSLEDWRHDIRRGHGGNRPLAAVNPDLPQAPLPQAQLYRLLWQPLESAIGEAETVIIIPDGRLWFLPFAALPLFGKERYLIERHALIVVPNSRAILPMKSMVEDMANWAKSAGVSPRPSVHKLVLVGDVDYAGDPLPVGPAPAPASIRPVFSALPGTRHEIQQIAAVNQERLPQSEVKFLTGSKAGTLALDEMASGARWLHIATHGFLFDDPWTKRRSAALALAAANGGPSSAGVDGILTPEEVTTLDLNVTDLVVLSACETGLGDPVRGEGLAGLQTAWHLAGAKTVVTSLWQVDDRATAALMVQFYRNLWERKLSKRQSLRQAQLAMLRGELSWQVATSTLSTERPDPRSRGLVAVDGSENPRDHIPPYYWAAFTLSGDGR